MPDISMRSFTEEDIHVTPLSKLPVISVLMDELVAVFRPFQNYFSHMRTIDG